MVFRACVATMVSLALFSAVNADIPSTTRAGTDTDDEGYFGAVSCYGVNGTVAGAPQTGACLGEGLYEENGTSCAEARGAIVMDASIPCCFDSMDDCGALAYAINDARSRNCTYFAFGVGNVTASSVRDCSATCLGSQYLIEWPSSDADIDDPGVCAARTFCNPLSEYRSEPAMCCSATQYASWNTWSGGPIPAFQLCSTPANCTSANVYPRTQIPMYVTDDVCSPITNCSLAEYVSAAPTPTSNTVCMPVTECNADTQHVVSEATTTSDRQCANISGAIGCFEESEGGGNYVYASYLEFAKGIPASAVYCLGTEVSSGWGALPTCNADLGGIMLVNDAVCCFTDSGTCASQALSINQRRTPECQPQQYLKAEATVDTLGSCVASCPENYLVLNFPATTNNGNLPGRCSPMLLCEPDTQYQSGPPTCCSLAQYDQWSAGKVGGEALPVGSVCTEPTSQGSTVPCGHWPQGPGAGTPVFMSNPVCSPRTQCTDSELTSTVGNITVDTVCASKEASGLSKADDAGIAVGSILGLIVIVCLLVWVYRSNKSLDATMEEFELTAKLLVDEREQNQRVRNAWEIDADQLTFGATIASGASGTVYKGNWMHIPVAIKTPRQDNVEFENEEFQKDAALMQSIR